MQNNLYRNLIKQLFTFVFCVGFLSAVNIAAQETIRAAKSNLTAVNLPTNAVRMNEGSVPAEVRQALEKLIASGGDKIRQGDSEVLAWTDGFKKSNAAKLINQLTANLQTAGWTYEVAGENEGVTVFSLLKNEPQKRAVIGFYTFSDDALVIAWTEMLAANSRVQTAAKNGSRRENDEGFETRRDNSPSNAKVLNVEKDAAFVNVMGVEMPAIPKFPALSPKSGRVRGYVKSADGKPLAGATIGVRASYFAGQYSGAQGTTDANGYYEFVVPKGSAHFYNAGYAIEWGEGLAAVGLHPADGQLESFTTVDGAVENFVLLPYGITSRENAQENPRLASTYYGGSIYIGYSAFEASDNYPPAYAVPENSIIEITLTPEGKLFDGSAGRSFVIRKAATFQTGFKINNIPLGRYQISVTSNGKPLKMKLNKPRGTSFGMTPNETEDAANILFSPAGAQAKMVSPQAGGWDSVEISVER
jgi:hypothetical protein